MGSSESGDFIAQAHSREALLGAAGEVSSLGIKLSQLFARKLNRRNDFLCKIKSKSKNRTVLMVRRADKNNRQCKTLPAEHAHDTTSS